MLRKLTAISHTHIYILLALICFHSYMGYEILKKSELCLTYDEANRLTDGLYCCQGNFAIDSILSVGGQGHPPFFKIITATACKLLKKFHGEINLNYLILCISIFFLSILLMSTYGIGSILYSKDVGLFSAFLLSFLPIIIPPVRTLSIDFALTAMVALSFYLLFKTKGFQSLKYSILSGIAIGLALLTKEGFLVLLPFPLAYYIYKSYRPTQKKGFLLNVALCLFFVLIVWGSVYLYPGKQLLPAFKVHANIIFMISEPFLYYFYHFVIYAGTYLGIALIPLLVSYLVGLRFKDKALFLWFSFH